MRIIEITALSNGAHRNQTTNSMIHAPGGWAVIPDGMETPNYPFGEVEVAEINGVMTVTKWTEGTVPEPEPEQEPEPTTEERIAALENENAMLKAQVSAQSDQMDFYEDCIAEMSTVVYA